jgi:hypothetical protein
MRQYHRNQVGPLHVQLTLMLFWANARLMENRSSGASISHAFSSSRGHLYEDACASAATGGRHAGGIRTDDQRLRSYTGHEL